MGGVRRCEDGVMQSVVPQQTLRPEFVCFVTLGNREKHRDRRSNAHLLESGVCGDIKRGSFKIRAVRDTHG